jgi:hypothetical protein
MSEKLDRKLIEHMATDERDFSYIKETMTRIAESQTKAETNHWSHVQASTGAIQEDLKTFRKDFQDLVILFTEHRSDLVWLKRFFWLVASSSVAGLVTSVLQLVLKTND